MNETTNSKIVVKQWLSADTKNLESLNEIFSQPQASSTLKIIDFNYNVPNVPIITSSNSADQVFNTNTPVYVSIPNAETESNVTYRAVVDECNLNEDIPSDNVDSLVFISENKMEMLFLEVIACKKDFKSLKKNRKKSKCGFHNN